MPMFQNSNEIIPSVAHPIPQLTKPARYCFPATLHINGPPESPYKRCDKR